MVAGRESHMRCFPVTLGIFRHRSWYGCVGQAKRRANGEPFNVFLRKPGMDRIGINAQDQAFELPGSRAGKNARDLGMPVRRVQNARPALTAMRPAAER